MSTLSRRLLSVALVALFTAGSGASAFAADGTWAKNHPRRVQVNSRLNHQDRRIHQDVKEGEITKAQAANLHRQDRQIRSEERLMASQNGSHLTKLEQHTLNQQENSVSREIGK